MIEATGDDTTGGDATRDEATGVLAEAGEEMGDCSVLRSGEGAAKSGASGAGEDRGDGLWTAGVKGDASGEVKVAGVVRVSSS